MANNHFPTSKPHKRLGIAQTHLKCIQLKPQHSRLSIENLRQIIKEDKTSSLSKNHTQSVVKYLSYLKS